MKTEAREGQDVIQDQGGSTKEAAPPPRWLIILYGAYAVWATAYLALYWFGA